MSRDFGSFLGGVPLSLKAVPSQAPVTRQPPSSSWRPRVVRQRSQSLFSESPVSLNLTTTQMPPMQMAAPPAPVAEQHEPAQLEEVPAIDEVAEDEPEVGSRCRKKGSMNSIPELELEPLPEGTEAIDDGLEFEADFGSASQSCRSGSRISRPDLESEPESCRAG